MEIKKLQEKTDEIINKMDAKTNCKHDINNTIIHLIEEIGELAKELNKPNIRNKPIDREELGNEIADVLFFITRIANLNEIDLEASINNKIKKLNEKYDLNL